MKTNSQDRIIVLIPAYNEEKTISQVIDSIKNACSYTDIVVIDDGSNDKTMVRSLEHGAIVLKSPTNLGYCCAIQTGLRYAFLGGYEYAVLLDADGQHDPIYIPDMIKYLRQNKCHIVIGSRWINRTSCNLTLIRRTGMRCLSIFVIWIAKQKISDTSSGFQLLSRAGIERLCKTNFPIRYPDADFIISLAKQGIVYGEIPVIMKARRNGQGMNDGLMNMLKYIYQMALNLIAEILPLGGYTRL
jgi:hypothetical protein